MELCFTFKKSACMRLQLSQLTTLYLIFTFMSIIGIKLSYYIRITASAVGSVALTAWHLFQKPIFPLEMNYKIINEKYLP